MLNIYRQQSRTPEELAADQKKISQQQTQKQADFRNYVDPTGELQSKQLERGIWLVSHRVWIYRAIVGALGLIGASFWIFSLVKWGIFLLDWQKQTQTYNQLATFPNYTRLHAQFAPQDLQLLDTYVFAGGVDKFDAVVEVVNPNERHTIQFDYYFLVGGEPTEKRTAMLMAGETKPLAILGLTGIDVSGEVVPVLEKIRWKRVNAHAISNPVSWQAERLAFEQANFVFIPASVGDEVPAHQITFDLTNNSPFGYVEPMFLVGLYNNETLVGTMTLTLQGFRSGETRKVDIRNFVRDLRVDSVRLYPQINVYDKEVYIRPEA